MNVNSREAAWAEANKIFPTDYEKDDSSSQRAGYDIYRHPTLNYYNRICDLGCRLEVLTGEYGDTVVNIWIVEAEETSDAEKKTAATESAAALPTYGTMLAEKIRTETTDFSKLTALEKFVLDNGYKFQTEEALRAGYDRAWKCSRDILLTEDEFAAEAGLGINTFSQWNEDTAREVYNALAGFAKAGKITAGEVYRYAHYKWCLRNPEAIVAYQEGRDRWEVNNCDTEVSEDEAKIAVNSEWGFEASRVWKHADRVRNRTGVHFKAGVHIASTSRRFRAGNTAYHERQSCSIAGSRKRKTLLKSKKQIPILWKALLILGICKGSEKQ